MSRRRSSREILQERTYPISIHDFPNLTFLGRHCGKPVTLKQLQTGDAVEEEQQRFNNQGEIETYAYIYYHQSCIDNYRRRIGLEKTRKSYQRGY